MARRMSSATGAPVFSDSASSFFSCSSFKKRAVRFMVILYHTGIYMSIGRKYWSRAFLTQHEGIYGYLHCSCIEP